MRVRVEEEVARLEEAFACVEVLARVELVLLRLEDNLVRRAVNLVPVPVVKELLLAAEEPLAGVNELFPDAELLLVSVIVRGPILEGPTLDKPVVDWLTLE